MDQVQLFLHANKHQLGYVMNEASRIWNEDVPGGAFTVGECYGIVEKYGTYDALLKENARLQELLEGNDGMSVKDIRNQFVNLHRDFLIVQTENKRLHEALEKVMEAEAPNMEGWETELHKIAREALGISQDECFEGGESHDA